MIVFFQVLKGIFYFSTLLMGIFLLRGNIIFKEPLYEGIKIFIMPGYLIFCGIMIGYLVFLGWTIKHPEGQNPEVKEKILRKSFIIGIVCGIILSISYILFK